MQPDETVAMSPFTCQLNWRLDTDTHSGNRSYIRPAGPVGSSPLFENAPAPYLPLWDGRLQVDPLRPKKAAPPYSMGTSVLRSGRPGRELAWYPLSAGATGRVICTLLTGLFQELVGFRRCHGYEGNRVWQKLEAGLSRFSSRVYIPLTI